MRIVQLTPGTGNFYCGSCMRDNALVKALRKQGHEAVLAPMYLPHFIDEESATGNTPLFFGGINVYLQQKWPLFRDTPAWLDRMLNSTAMLNLAASQAGMTAAHDLGEMTISMVLGEQGSQAKEVEKVVAWLAREENRPDVVCLSNLLLIGVAHRIKEALHVPVICTLHGEDGFINALPEPGHCWSILAERAADISEFIAVSRYYKEVMLKRLGLEPEKITVVHNGINLEGYFPAAPNPAGPPVIGYLARMHAAKGLGVLIEAFIKLKERNRIPDVRLRIAGSRTASDRPFVRSLRQRLKQAGCEHHVEFLPNLDRTPKQAFLRTLDVLSVPARGESFGLYILEALACGVPVVQPAEGAFPELIEATGGGTLCKAGDPEALAMALEEALADRAQLAAMGLRAMAVVHARFTSETMAGGFIEVCERVCGPLTGL